jgi:hypothetical protein
MLGDMQHGPDLRLVACVYVDLVRHASALCPR